MLNRAMLQESAYEYMHIMPFLFIALLTIIVALGRQRISGNIIRATALVYSSIVLAITYVGLIDPHMVDDPGIGPLLRWAFASIFLAPQFLVSAVVIYANAMGYRFPASDSDLCKYSTVFIVCVGWSWFIISGVDAAG
jgi:hypothetical protein